MNERLRQGLVAAEGPLSGEVIKDVECVAGGCIHQAWCLQLKGGRQLFAKTAGADALPMLKVEVEGLKALKAWVDPGVLEVPEPLAFDQVCGEAVLLLPWLDFRAGNQASWAVDWPFCIGRLPPKTLDALVGPWMVLSVLALSQGGGGRSGATHS